MDFKDFIDANGHAEIPEGTDKIPQRAFKGCKALKSVTIPSSVSVIQTNAFEDCESLTSIVIPDAVKRIGRDCFKSCKNLTEVKLPQSITLIDFGLFSGCTSLKEIVIPEGVTNISGKVFSGCSSLTNVVLPDSVTVLGIQSQADTGEDGPFRGCSRLTSIKLPNRLEIIGFGCFARCSSLNSISLPNGLKEIGSWAFSECSKLETIALPDSLEVIGYSAFFQCPLTRISIPSKIKKIRSFRECRRLEEVLLPDGLESIGAQAFYGCKSLTGINIPDSVTIINSGAFSKSSITSITIPAGVKRIESYTFSDCSFLRTISLPKVMDSIGENAFENCVALEEVDIPEGVSLIPENAFANCKSVHIHLSSTVRSFKRSWSGSIEAKEISISAYNKALSVENNCVVGQNSRTLGIILPGATAFPRNIRSINVHKDSFPSLYDVEELVIPEGVEYIDNLPFKLMTKLKKLQLPASMKSCGSDFMKDYPLSDISVSPELFLSDNFRAWRDINKVNLIGIDSVSDELLEKVKEKYKKQKAGWEHYGRREGSERLFWVYLNGQIVYPAAHIVKKKEEAIAAQVQKEAEDKLNSKKKEMADKLEDITISSLCAATLGKNGFEFKYDERNNKVEVIVLDEIRFWFKLNLDTAQEDLSFLLDVATTYRNALKPYVEKSPAPLEASYSLNQDKSGYFICGTPFPKTRVFLSVQSDTVSIAFNALEELSKAYKDLSQKYGEKFGKVAYSKWLC